MPRRRSLGSPAVLLAGEGLFCRISTRFSSLDAPAVGTTKTLPFHRRIAIACEESACDRFSRFFIGSIYGELDPADAAAALARLAARRRSQRSPISISTLSL